MNQSAAEIPHLSTKEEIEIDIKNYYKQILKKHLEDRIIKEEKIKSWMNNILIDSKEYFINKYPNYDLFLYIYVCPRNVYFRGKCSSISILKKDSCNSIDLQTEYLYCALYFFFYTKADLTYSLDEYEDEIIQKGNEILDKYLEGRKYNYDKLAEYNEGINSEYNDFILSKEKQLRSFGLNEIYQNPIKSKYYFKYLSYGKNIYSKIFQTYTNDSLKCNHYHFFFK